MKNVILSLLLWLTLFLLSGCAVTRKKIPTCYYQLKGTDTTVLSPHSLRPESLKIMLVHTPVDYTSLIENRDVGLDYKSNKMDVTTFPSFNMLVGRDASYSQYKGKISSQLLNSAFLSELFSNLSSMPVGGLQRHQLSQRQIDRHSLDSLFRESGANMAITVDSIVFYTSMQMSNSTWETGDLISRPPGGWMTTIDTSSSGVTVVYYTLHMTLFEYSPLSGRITEERKFLQVGNHVEMGSAFSAPLNCARKASKDFALLFKSDKAAHSRERKVR